MRFRLLAAFLLLVCLFALPDVASAQYIDPKRIESNLMVTGTIDVAADGIVLGYTLDQLGKLPKPVLNLVAGIAPHWKFEPVNDPAPQRLSMSLRFIAKRADDAHVRITLRSAQFAMPQAAADTRLALDPSHRITPQYPNELNGRGIEATVYLAIRAHPDGTADTMVRRVDLHTAGLPTESEQWRKAFARSVMAASRKWHYLVPKRGAGAGREFWLGTLPVSFSLEGNEPVYGVWKACIPGPETIVPWETDADRDANYDAASANEILGADARRRLLTPLPKE
jgi:hypothetical protein